MSRTGYHLFEYRIRQIAILATLALAMLAWNTSVALAQPEATAPDAVAGDDDDDTGTDDALGQDDTGTQDATAGTDTGQPGDGDETGTGDTMAQPEDEGSATPTPVPAADEVPSSYADWFQSMMDKSHKPFEFHGYFRAGFGINGKGGDQEAFQAPTTPAKYRLGNETETYGELILVNNWLNPQRDTDAAWFKTQILLTFVAFNNQNFDSNNDLFTVREAYGMAGNVFKSMPDLKFWAGQRYYRRHDIHINDFFHYSESGYGGGIEDYAIGDSAKMAVAYFGNSDPNGTDVTENGRVVENNLEARFYDFNVPGGSGILGAKVSYSRGGTRIDGTELPDVPGFLLSFFHIRGGFMGGFNKFGVQFGYGGSSDIESPLFYKTPDDNLKGSMQLLITETAQANLTDRVSSMWTALFRLRLNTEADTSDMWISAGFRPIYHFTKYSAIAAEAGVDFVGGDIDLNADGENDSGALFKFSVAPQIRAGDFFWARPTIRAYATIAAWPEAFQGFVGGVPYANDNYGLAFGVQAESWW